MSTYRILVVDDSALNRKLVTTILHANHFEVLEAVDGEQAITVATSERPSLILMDIQLPKLDGYEATRRLRAQPETKDIPIIALTANAMAGEDERAQAAGCDGYISKPIDTRSLVPALIPFLKQGRKLPQ